MKQCQNWNQCKKEIEIGLDSSIQQIISASPKVTTKEFVEWERFSKKLTVKSFFYDNKQKFIGQTLQDALIEYLNKLHKSMPLSRLTKLLAILP